MSFLSERNGHLEAQLKTDPDSLAALANLRRHNALLLSILGEKEEELEALKMDLMDTRGLYREEIDSLLKKLAPP